MWAEFREAMRRRSEAERVERAARMEAQQRIERDARLDAQHGPVGGHRRPIQSGEALAAWNRGDSAYVCRTSVSGLMSRGEVERLNAKLNSITAVGWKLVSTSSQLTAIVHTFARPS